MGIALRLYPEIFPREDGLSIFLAVGFHLDFDSKSFFDSVREGAVALPVSVELNEDEGLRSYTTDPYGNLLTFINAGLFLKLWDTWDRDHKYLHKELDRAAIAYIRALKPERRIILWWH